MSDFVDLEFIKTLAQYLKNNISELKQCEIYQFPERPMFPIAIISYNQTRERIQDVDSERDKKYLEISLNIEIFTKTTSQETNRYLSGFELKNKIISLIKTSDNYKNLLLTFDRVIPNLDSQVCRIRLTFEGVVNIKQNTIL